MVSVRYSEAAVEVLDILKYTKEEDVQKIPKTFIEFLENNKSKSYVPNLDHKKEIKDMELKPETEALLGLIYMKYWANEEEKLKFEDKIKNNEIAYQDELNAKYNVDNLFKEKAVENKEEMPTVIKQKSLLQKIIDKIKNIFRR